MDPFKGPQTAAPLGAIIDLEERVFMKKSALLIMMGLAFLGAMGFTVNAATISASLSANPISYSGKCPAVITFSGQITSDSPGMVQYKFIRSDDANAPIQTLNFDKAGSIAVSTTWTLGGPGLPTYAGWQAIQVVYPQQVQSNKAEFKVQCQEPPQQKITAKLLADPISYKGKCPVAITFEGEISVTVPCTVQYKFLRSDGATDTNLKSLVFEGPGTKSVSTTWTLGGASLPDYEGWEAIQVTAPLSAESNKASFKMSCVGIQVPPLAIGKKPDLGMYGFLKIGKNSKEVKWNETITLTPEDATLVSGGKPAFDLYYDFREYNGVAVPGPFKNKIFFNDNLVSQQTNLSCGAMEIKNIHTQAYLGPEDGKLQIKIDADNETAESNEDNNFNFFVNLNFKGFDVRGGFKKPIIPGVVPVETPAQPSGGAIAQPGSVIETGKTPQLLDKNKEDCVSFNPDTTEVKKHKNDWRIVDGDHSMFNFHDKKDEADKALAIIKFYRMNESCFVGRPDPSFSYLKVSGAAPTGAFTGEDCIAFNPAAIEAKKIDGDWKIVQGDNWLFSFGKAKDEAHEAMAIIKKYGFTQACFVGRPGPSFTYLRK
jgi:hypothetical protein